MDPVTAIRTSRNPTGKQPQAVSHPRRARPEAVCLRLSCDFLRLSFDQVTSVEAVTTGAAAARVRVVDGEALLLDRVGEVDRGALEVRGAHPVDDDAHAVEVADQVAVERTLV